MPMDSAPNGTLGPDGYIHLPLLNEQFPEGYIITTQQTNSYFVQLFSGASSALQSYDVGRWKMSNYVSPTGGGITTRTTRGSSMITWGS